MNLRNTTRLAAACALSFAAALGAALPSSAAPSVASRSAQEADPILSVELKRFDPADGATQPIHTFACPPKHPWLVGSYSGFGLRGIEIHGDGYAAGDVTVDVRPMRDLSKLAVGWEGTRTAVTIHHPHDDDFTLVAKCTDDRALAYLG